MRRYFTVAILSFLSLVGCHVISPRTPASPDENPEKALLTETKQLTFQGKRSGEGYFSPNGQKLIFQSEREKKNPFYQMYVMDLGDGVATRVSPGYGKTTCGWIHPDEDRVLFSSTHLDPFSRKKQRAEIEKRKAGKKKKYQWDFDEHYELFSGDVNGGGLTRLTDSVGYDAEGSYSPDGTMIVFASNRHAYLKNALTEEEKKALGMDPSRFMDIYTMSADGGQVTRLTTEDGYDGGPFFSADGKKIVWRKFGKEGATAEVYTMNVDGSGKKQVTALGAMSWAPYFHPSGNYIIFATNVQGFKNFELYLIDADGQAEPVRVTFTDGFDGLPVFSPDGATLSWTSKRTPDKTSQIFTARWNDRRAREMLGLPVSAGERTTRDVKEPLLPSKATVPEIRGSDLKKHIVYLASEKLEGRLTGREGEKLATAYAAKALKSYGFVPVGSNGSFFQEFEFTAGVSPGPKNELSVVGIPGAEVTTFAPGELWRPVAFSRTGWFEPTPVVFAGYGISAPKSERYEEYDSYVHLDVKDKWVLLFRFLPEGASPGLKKEFRRYASIRYKAREARERGAKGVIMVSGPHSKVKDQLVPMAFDSVAGETSIGVITVADEVGEKLFQAMGKTLEEVQKQWDSGTPQIGFELSGITLKANIDVKYEKHTGRNVVAKLRTGPGNKSVIALGAHIDHLGRGTAGSSLAKNDEAHQIHYGADDNASGVAAVLEIAERVAHQVKNGELIGKRDLLVGLWSGEELGLLGSEHFTVKFKKKGKKKKRVLTPEIAAYINLDMVGRLTDKLVLQGLGSSSVWLSEVEKASAPLSLPVVHQQDTYLPTDTMSFYLKGVPILSAFTGLHEEYHTPRDTEDKINYSGAERVGEFLFRIVKGLLQSRSPIDYRELEEPSQLGTRAYLRAYLGTIPDYTGTDVKGVKLGGVTKGGPAEKAGLERGDVIVELSAKKIENIYDYTFTIEALEVGKEVDIVVQRGGEKVRLTIVPESRE